MDLNGNKTNSFLTSMELTTAQNEYRWSMQQQGVVWLLSLPPLAHTNPFLCSADPLDCQGNIAHVCNQFTSTPCMSRPDMNANKHFLTNYEPVRCDCAAESAIFHIRHRH